MRAQLGLCFLAAQFLAGGVAPAADFNPTSLPVPKLIVAETGEYPVAAECGADAEQLLDVTGQPAGCEFWSEAQEGPRKLAQLGSGQAFTVEPLNASLVSSGGRTLLKYGTFANVALPAGERFAWVLYSAEGRRLAEKRGDLAGDAAVAMAADGHFAIVDRGAEGAGGEASKLTLYAPLGTEISSASLGIGVIATQIAVRDGGETIALALTDAEKYRDGTTDIVLYSKSAERIGAIENIRYPNALTFAGSSGDHLLASARGTLMLLNARDATVVWKTNRFYRLALPLSAGVSPDGRYLSIITTALPPKPQRDYHGRAHLLSMDDGRQLSAVDLPGTYMIGKMPVTTQFGDRSIELKSPDKQRIKITID